MHIEGRFIAHLVLLREPQVVVGFQQLNVLCQLADGDGRVAHHPCDSVKVEQSQRGAQTSANLNKTPRFGLALMQRRGAN